MQILSLRTMLVLRHNHSGFADVCSKNRSAHGTLQVTSAAVAAAAAISQPAPPPDVFQTAAWALLRGGAAGSIAALALQALRKGAPADGEEVRPSPPSVPRMTMCVPYVTSLWLDGGRNFL